MSIVDEDTLLTQEEREAYRQLLTLHGYEPYHFLVEVTEDQGPIDMNDINYIIILKVKVTHTGTNRTHTYMSQFGSQTWIAEFEADLSNQYYSKSA